jgi:hypothetical protein
MPAQIVNDRPVIDAAGSPVDLDRRELAGLASDIRGLAESRRELLQLIKEGLDLFTNPETVLDLREWLQSAKAAIARAEGGGR